VYTVAHRANLLTLERERVTVYTRTTVGLY